MGGALVTIGCQDGETRGVPQRPPEGRASPVAVACGKRRLLQAKSAKCGLFRSRGDRRPCPRHRL